MNLNFDNDGILLSDIANICNGRLFLKEKRNVKGISTNSRNIKNNDLFFAIKGENFDGHNFIAQAFADGAAGAIAEYMPEGDNVGNVILVENTVKALGMLGTAYKRSIDPLTVAVTGSVGKTTVKQMIYSVLSQKFNTHKSDGNFNNEIGLPLSLLALSKESTAAVFELGMSGRGEIEYLSKLAVPDIAVITCIGTSHIGLLGSRENIRDAKLEITAGLKDGGKLIVNADDDMLMNVENAVKVSLNDHNADYFVSDIKEHGSYSSFDMYYPGGGICSVHVPSPGLHLIRDAALAFAAGHIAGVVPNDICRGIANYSTDGARQRIEKLNNGITLIHDYYNASPESMKASLGVLTTKAKEENKRSIAVLGSMLELGRFSHDLHFSIGEFCVTAGLDVLFTYGKEADAIAEGALKAGMNEKNIRSFQNSQEPDKIADSIKKLLSPNDIIMMKASRAIKMENVAKLICEEY